MAAPPQTGAHASSGPSATTAGSGSSPTPAASAASSSPLHQALSTAQVHLQGALDALSGANPADLETLRSANLDLLRAADQNQTHNNNPPPPPPPDPPDGGGSGCGGYREAVEEE
jgi:hypothetical protein